MANDLNQCQFIGRLGNDPEIRYQTNGNAIASLSLAVGSQWKDKSGEKQESTEWISCTAFGRMAEIIGEYLEKGSQVFISGRMKTDKYEKDGITRYSTKIIVESMQMLGGRSEKQSQQTDSNKNNYSKPNNGASKQNAKPATNHSNFDNFDDDIPF